jgi:N,N'-diacetyllegionaminate synthase
VGIKDQETATFVIAEVGQAHDGSLGVLHSYIDAVSETGVDAIKFQTHVADAGSSPLESFRINFSYEDLTRQDYWRRMEFTAEQWSEIKKHCESVGLEFMSTPTCVSALNILEKIGVKRYKIGSGDTTNNLLLHKVAETKKQVIISSGLSSYDEIDSAIDIIKKSGNDNIVIMQCTSEYPVPPERVGLNLINEFRNKYKYPIGLSDHSGLIYPSLAAVTLGAAYIETHVVFDRTMFGPDSASSLTISEFKSMVEGIRVIEKSLCSEFSKESSEGSDRMRRIFGKSLSVNRNMIVGEEVKINDLETKKPAGEGVSAQDYEKIIGRRLVKNLKKWDFIKNDDVLYDKNENI